jgi:2-keto-4-pentenoate hydratase
MTKQEIADSVRLLAQAWRSRTRIEGLSASPASVAEAHAIQDQVAAVLGETIGAFKANAPPDIAPTRGLIYARMIRRSPARISPAETPYLGVEGEIAFRFMRDLPAQAKPYARDEIAAAVAVLPAIEVVSSRFHDPYSRSPLEQLADCMINGALVIGSEILDWSQLDLPRLHVALLVNDKPVLERQGRHPTDDPLAVAVALVNMMRDAGGVKAGQLVTTGSWTELRRLRSGDRCAVQFEKLGSAQVLFAD